MKEHMTRGARGWIGRGAALALLAMAGLVQAQGQGQAAAGRSDGTDALPLWELGAGVGVLYGPAYLGSSTYRAYVAPLPFGVYRGERVRANREGVGVRLLENSDWRIDMSLNGALPVQSRDTAREGMRDLPPVLEVGPVLKYQFANDEDGRYRAFHWPVRYGFGVSGKAEHVGWISDPTLRIIEPLYLGGMRVNWGLDVSVKLQSAQFNDFYYGVRGAEVTPGRAAYRSEGGYSGLTVNTGLLVRRDPLVMAAFVGMTELSGARFIDSPLIERKRNAFGGVAVFWVWQKSEQTVSRRLFMPQ